MAHEIGSENDGSELPPEERNRVYSARELVDLALEGHFCIREAIDSSIHYVEETRGSAGRDEMYKLGGLPAYPSEEEIDRWQETLLQIADRIRSEEQHRPEREDSTQLKMFE